jgi:transcriptional regulator NrdR family protein
MTCLTVEEMVDERGRVRWRRHTSSCMSFRTTGTRLEKITMSLIDYDNSTASYTSAYSAPHRVAFMMSAARSATA